jgi:hypothetical protein
MRWIPIMNRIIPRKAKQAIATFTQIDISIDDIIPPWQGKFPRIPLTTQLDDCSVFRYTPFYFKNKFNVKRKNIDHRVRPKNSDSVKSALQGTGRRVESILLRPACETTEDK